MIKPNLRKAVMLGLGMAVFSTSITFAQVRSAQVAPEFRGEIAIAGPIELYDKQKEIDLYLFADHVDEVKNKGISIAYTGVMKDVVEIGITPYTDENAEYLYGIFGKKEVRVVEAAVNVVYANTTDAAVSDLVVGTAIDGSDIMLPDGAVSIVGEPGSSGSSQGSVGSAAGSTDALTDEELMYTTTGIADTEDSSGIINGDKAVSSEGDFKIQITSTDSAAEGTDVRAVALANDQEASKDDKAADTNKVDSSVIVLAIAGGAILVGGGLLVTKKKNTDK